MTSPIAFPAHVIGLMSGTSADGVDAALLTTDGRAVVEAGPSVFVPYSDALRADILGLMRESPPPNLPPEGGGTAERVAAALTDVHIEAVKQLLKKANVKADLIGFHGQTIRHAPHEGITVQIGEPARMAWELGIPVVADFRTNDVRHGGQGAPLVPLYHAALVEKLPKPVMVVNIGGVANVTWVGESLANSPQSSGKDTDHWQLITDNSLLAFDCGPGNALIDDWVHRHTGARYDKDGALAARGKVDDAAVAAFLKDDFFARGVPKSLDRHHFTHLVPDHNKDWNLEDGAATLTAMTAAGIAESLKHVPQTPQLILVGGGGRHNPTLMGMLREMCSGEAAVRNSQAASATSKQMSVEVKPVKAVGWDGDMLEAQAFAYLAARSVQGLSLSLPSTTGVKEPVSGGTLYVPDAPHHHHDNDDDNCTAPRSCCR